MCGIAGIVSLRAGLPPPSIDQLARMAGALRHRGPDEFGVYRDENAGFAHARLSIIDHATGQQPLSNRGCPLSQGRPLWVVFNGEIFNYVELRAELISLGHVFHTGSDTEVIVHAYESWEADAFARFNGQFAIGLWDARRKAFCAARDRLGERPLYVCDHQGRLHFASEVKALFAGEPSIRRALDPTGLLQTFTLWTVVPPQSVFQGISELEPGHVRTYAGSAVHDREFWRPRYPVGGEGAFDGSLDDAVTAVRESLEQATRLRMLRADVPVGSYLSGGLDSSLIAALALRAKGEKFTTFSLRFQDAEYDETEFQRLMVRELGTEHHEAVVSRGDIARVFPRVIEHTERPLLRTAPAPLFLLSRMVRDAGVKVVLSGEAADEMFAGYDLFREAKVRRFWARQPTSRARSLLLQRLYPYLARSPVSQHAMSRHFFARNLDRAELPGFSHEPRWHTTSALRRLLSRDLLQAAANDPVAQLLASLPDEFSRWSFLAQDQYLETRTLLSGYLLSSQGDRMLMAHSVEGRFPFLDVNVIELANSLPPEYKLRVLDEKHVLKRAAKGLVPKQICARHKQPYRAPDALSFVGDDAPEYLEECFSHRAIAEAQVFDPVPVAQLWKKCRARREEARFGNADNMAIVGVISTQLLHALFIRRPIPVPAPVTLRIQVDNLRNLS